MQPGSALLRARITSRRRPPIACPLPSFVPSLTYRLVVVAAEVAEVAEVVEEAAVVVVEAAVEAAEVGAVAVRRRHRSPRRCSPVCLGR
jgi:hypothetical protein